MNNRESNFNIYLEIIKREYGFDSYIETVTWFAENESDMEIDQIAKHLNKKITEEIRKEAIEANMVKEKKSDILELFE